MKLASFDCANTLTETRATTMSLLFVNMSSWCYDLVILFHFCEVFSKKYIGKIFRACQSWILCLIEQIKPKYWIDYLDQRRYEIPKFSKKKVRFEIRTFQIEYMCNFVKIRKLIIFVPKMPKFGDFSSTFSKNNVRCDINTFQIGYG